MTSEYIPVIHLSVSNVIFLTETGAGAPNFLKRKICRKDDTWGPTWRTWPLLLPPPPPMDPASAAPLASGHTAAPATPPVSSHTAAPAVHPASGHTAAPAVHPASGHTTAPAVHSASSHTAAPAFPTASGHTEAPATSLQGSGHTAAAPLQSGRSAGAPSSR